MSDAPAYSNFVIDRNDLPDGVEIFGNGEVGGKARGIIYSMDALRRGHIKGDYLDLVKFPRSYVLTSEYFDDYIDLNYLNDIVSDKCREILSIKEMRQKFIKGDLPENLLNVLYTILEKESGPLIVRSSSILEDSLEYSFAGIYDSFFTPNRGTLEHRVNTLEQTVKMVYASTFGNNAKEYRKRHKIPWQREKMALVIENVIGREQKDDYYYPFMAGVSFSRNYYPWNPRIRMEDGVGRLVLGFGTRAVGRDYARVFSLSNPSLRPEGSVLNEIVRYSQKKMDVINLSTEEFRTEAIDDIKHTSSTIYLACSTLKDNQYLEPTSRHISEGDRLLPTFDRLLKSDRYYPFVSLMRELLTSLEGHFGVPIDIEFAFDMDDDMNGSFYLLQARPIVNRPELRKVKIPELDDKTVIVKSGNVLGNGSREGIKHIVYVSPETYSLENAYSIAREIGKLNEILDKDQYILVGPGRWGTSTPELGVPVNYSEISNAAVIVELSTGTSGPEFSYGTHFFGDITATNTLYIPVYMNKGGFLNTEFFDKQANKYGSEILKLVTLDEGFNVYVSAENGIGVIIKK